MPKANTPKADNPNYDIKVSVNTEFLEDQSSMDQERYAFAYTITIENNDEQAVQLLSRHWIITDGDEQVQEVYGEGVVGQKPRIPAGKSFSYTSGAVLDTPVGTMEGSYQLIDEENTPFEVEIPPFLLAQERVLH